MHLVWALLGPITFNTHRFLFQLPQSLFELFSARWEMKWLFGKCVPHGISKLLSKRLSARADRFATNWWKRLLAAIAGVVTKRDNLSLLLFDLVVQAGYPCRFGRRCGRGPRSTFERPRLHLLPHRASTALPIGCYGADWRLISWQHRKNQLASAQRCHRDRPK